MIITPRKELKGIKGWLLLYVILFIFGLLVNIYFVLDSMTVRAYIPAFIILMFVFFMINNLYLIFKKKKRAIRFSINLLWFALVIGIIGEIALAILDGEYQDLVANLILSSGKIIGLLFWTLVWIRYWQESKRVENTFVR